MTWWEIKQNTCVKYAWTLTSVSVHLHLNRNPKQRTLTQAWNTRQGTIKLQTALIWCLCLPIASSEQVTPTTFTLLGRSFFRYLGKCTNGWIWVWVWVSTRFPRTITWLVTHSLDFPLMIRKRFVQRPYSQRTHEAIADFPHQWTRHFVISSLTLFCRKWSPHIHKKTMNWGYQSPAHASTPDLYSIIRSSKNHSIVSSSIVYNPHTLKADVNCKKEETRARVLRLHSNFSLLHNCMIDSPNVVTLIVIMAVIL